MYELKTKPNDLSVIEFIEKVESPQKKEDAYKILDIFTETSGFEPKMWGDSIIGFGQYHYVYKSGHEGDAPLVGFSPRKSNFSLYFAAGDEDRDKLLRKFGKHKSGAACVYIKKLEDVDVDVMKELIIQSIEFLNGLYPPES